MTSEFFDEDINLGPINCVTCGHQMLYTMDVEYFREFPLCPRCFNDDDIIVRIIRHRAFEAAVKQLEMQGSTANVAEILNDFRKYLKNK
jgi:hypothetical protein